MNAKKILVAFALNGILFWAVDANAQQPPPKPATPPTPQPTVSIQFSGGNLADYVKALKDAAPGMNIALLVPEAKEIRVPPLKLDSVAYGAALELLAGEYQLGTDNVVKLLVRDFGGPPGGEGSAPVYKIWSDRREMRRPPAQVRVWNIGELLGPDRKSQDVLTAVETAVGLLGDFDKAMIRYHAETSLLIASGDEEQLHAIDRVMAGIQEGTRKRVSNVLTNQQLQYAIDKLKEGNASAEAIGTLEALQKAAQELDKGAAKSKENPTRKDEPRKPSPAP